MWACGRVACDVINVLLSFFLRNLYSKPLVEQLDFISEVAVVDTRSFLCATGGCRTGAHCCIKRTYANNTVINSIAYVSTLPITRA